MGAERKWTLLVPRRHGCAPLGGKHFTMTNLHRLRHFIGQMTSVIATPASVGGGAPEPVGGLVADLVGHDDWLPESMARCPPHGYAQNLLWCDPLERFCVVSFVWAPSAR